MPKDGRRFTAVSLGLAAACVALWFVFDHLQSTASARRTSISSGSGPTPAHTSEIEEPTVHRGSDAEPVVAPEQGQAPHRAAAAQHEPGVVAEWAFDSAEAIPLHLGAREPGASGPASRFTVPLGSGREANLVVDRFETVAEDEGVFHCSVENRPGAWAVMSFVGHAQYGTLTLPDEGRAYNFRTGDDGVLRITELDLAHAPQCGVGPVPNPGIDTPPSTL